ncbi:DNA-binding transcriptional regulator, PucR family [Micromonospora pattaloongensis]|uniref:DNA-binding transcriptional regulator, PucR family n=1 Tax=Micromonospora pattaloongensis TaxID=405436 RepID=A0A1H3RHP7_9ACTN|nr:helix-turn-helix domain-containing protein [Micromonospora pattaloongensis]SDZ24875.1 DNA-binding transcriptional regulator, PucR family [Micromonospora pattaloongensis]
MQGELQRIVDAVAARVGRPALIEDRRQRVLVYSEHSEPMDEVRRASILSRQTSPEVVAWFRRAGIMAARTPVRTAACPELDLLARVCLPVRHDDLLLGFVWFIDADGTMSDADVDTAADATADLALALYRETLLGELASQRETEAARTLLVEAPANRSHAVRALLEEGVLAGDGPTTALVAQLVTADGEGPDEVARIALEQALVRTRRWLGPRAALHLVRHDHGALLLCGPRGAGRPTPDEAAAHLDAGLRHATRGVGSVARTVVGIGQTRPRLADGAGSYDEAVQSARVAVQLSGLGRVVDWSRLGVYRVLARLDGEHLDVGGVHPGLERLLRDQAHRVLLETLETYLDLAGNAHATAEQLRLHRTTLYYRLQRVEQLAETDLKDGNERLCLHLALKLGRLTGDYQPQ